MVFVMGVFLRVICVGVFVIKNCAGGQRGFRWKTVYFITGIANPNPCVFGF